MSIIRALLGLERRSGDVPSGGLALSLWQRWMDGVWGPTTSGLYIDHETALTVSAVYSCVKIIAETVGMLPLKLKRRLPDGSSEDAIDEPLYWVLQQPNDESTQMHFFMTATGHAAMRGNAYAQLIRDGKGRVQEIWPLHPDRVWVQRKNGVLVYVVSPNEYPGNTTDYTVFNTGGPLKYLRPDQIMHFKLMSLNGVTGLSPLALHRNGMALAMAQEEYSAKLYSNGAMPRGILTSDEDLDDDEFENVKEQWKKLHTGVWNAHKTAVLPKGIKWQGMSFTAEDAQYLQSRKFQLAEIARIFRIALHLLQELERSTNNNITQQSLEFLTYTMTPWLVNWEQTINMQVLTSVQREKGLYVEFDEQGLTRCDENTQSQIDDRKLKNGTLSINEVRVKAGLKPVEGGDEHNIQVNMGAVENPQSQNDQSGDPEDSTDQNDPIDDQATETKKKQAKKAKKQGKKRSEEGENEVRTTRERAINAFRALVESEIRQIQRKEAVAITRQAKKLGPAEFERWLEEFSRDDLCRDLSRTLTPVLRTVASGLIELDAEREQSLQERLTRLSETYAAGVGASVKQLIQRSTADGDIASWQKFIISLDGSDLENERAKIARMIAENEVGAILAMEGEAYAAA